MSRTLPDLTTIAVEDDGGGVALVWLDRPDRGNAFTFAMQAELHAAFAALDADDAVRAIVVTGRGRFFSTGADMEGGGGTFAQDADATAALRSTVAVRTRPWRMRTPVIGALNGAAVGLGLTLPLQWDIRYVAQDAKYGFVFVRRGLTPEAGSAWLLPRLIGASAAAELMLTGRLVLGAELARLGLASAALPAEEVLPTALRTAHEIADHCAPHAVAMTKQLLHEALASDDIEATWSRDWELFRWIGRQPDAAEGVAAFLAKREPAWTGSKNAPAPPAPDHAWQAPA